MSELSYEIDIISGKVSVISIESVLKKIGFPENWRDIINID